MTSPLDLLKAGDIANFNTQRGERTRLDLFAAELGGCKLVGADLSGANLDKADLTEADLTDANLTRAFLSDIDGSKMILSGALAMGAKLRDAWVEGVILDGADLSRADLSGAVLKGSSGEGVRMARAKLKEVDATGVVWPQADLAEAHLTRANFTGADLRGGDLSEAVGKDVQLPGARLDGVVASGVRLPDVNLAGASLVGARLDGALLAGADLSGAVLTGADLSRANLTGAKLTGAKLQGTVLAEASLDDVDFEGLDLEGVDLSGHDPVALGLQPEQVAALSAYGAAVDPDSPLLFDGIEGASRPDGHLLLWENLDDEERSSIRWVVASGRRKPRFGVMPMSAEHVLAKGVVASEAGYTCVLLHDRPGGIIVVRYEISATGEVLAVHRSPLGYSPAVVPVIDMVDGRLTLYGLARRGPTVVVHQLTDDGLVPVHSAKNATARGYLGHLCPVLASKGGVVTPVGSGGCSGPLRTPKAFPGREAVAVSCGDKVLAAWTVSRAGERAGGVRVAWLGGRGAPEEEVLDLHEARSLDGRTFGDDILLAWIRDTAVPVVVVARLPAGELQEIAVDELPESVRFTQGVPQLIVETSAGVSVIAYTGKVLADY